MPPKAEEGLVDGGAGGQQAWLSYKSLKEGFDAHANKFGYLDTNDQAAINALAGFLGLDAKVVGKEMKAIDFDANDRISFAEFALWADKHTVGIPLGIEVVDKRQWQKGMPAYWTTVPEAEPEEDPFAAPAPVPARGPAIVGASSSGGSSSSGAGPPPFAPLPPDPDVSELEDLIGAAKEFQWPKVWEILGRHPGYVDMRPPYRRYAAIHQAAYQGDVEVLRRYIAEFKADPRLKTKDGQTPEEVAKENGNAAAAEFLAKAAGAAGASAADGGPPAKKAKLAHAEAASPALLERANEIIEKAKWQKWSEMFELIKANPGCENLRPELRKFGTVHQVAFAGDLGTMKRLLEGKADPGVLTRDGQTALQVAEAEAHVQVAEYLAGLEKSVTGVDKIQLSHKVIDAAKQGHWELCFELLAANPDLVNLRPPVRQYGIFHQAAFHGDIEVLRRLIEDFKANVKQLTKDGQTALQIARENKQEAAAKYLEACIPTVTLEDDFVTFPEQKFVKVTDKALLKRFQDLLTKSHKGMCNWTRDRDYASGKFQFKTPVPTGYEVVSVVRNENPALWRIYQVCREITKLQCAKPDAEQPFSAWKPLTMEKGLDWSDFDLRPEANEWMLLHASIPEALTAIARTGFTMAKLGSGGTTGGGGLYGDGTYFADSITKADEYARRKVEKGEHKGLRAAAVCRVLGGRHFYTDKEVSEAEKPNFQKRVFEGHFNSTVGDRLKLKNTFREYVIYDASATYLEYVIFYKRKGVPKKHE